MGDNSPRLLTVAVTSRALFDLEESHALFESDGVAAYAEFQRQHEDDILGPGVAFPVVRKLLALNQGASPENPRVEVILLITVWASSARRSPPASRPGPT
ncbi:hypothetical protein G6F65_021778 [Rhizopus arrhizus]|nr:hypothetical protein G6F65_021778 [Rhizopus arrhizus]